MNSLFLPWLEKVNSSRKEKTSIVKRIAAPSINLTNNGKYRQDISYSASIGIKIHEEETVISHFLGSYKHGRPHQPDKKRQRSRRRDRRSTHARLNKSKSMKRSCVSCVYDRSTDEVGSTIPNTRQKSKMAKTTTINGLMYAINCIIPDGTDEDACRGWINSSLQRASTVSVQQACEGMTLLQLKIRGSCKKYHKKGGPHYNVLQETHCLLIIELKFANGEGATTRQFAGWDGSVLHHVSNIITVDAEYDRLDRRACKKVFDAMAVSHGYQTSQICQIYEIVSLDTKAQTPGR